jgi:fructokinase
MKPTSLRPEGVLCIGELLWDVFPNGRHLGGAPPNVAVHLRSLGIPSAVASRVGEDEAGVALRAQLAELGMTTDLIQTDPRHPTGLVTVDLSDPQSPRYTIEQPAAWDFIDRTPELAAAAAGSQAIVFGSLAQRNPISRSTIRSVLPDGALRIFDVNLRPPFDDRRIVEDSLRRSDLVKLNDLELAVMREWFGLPTDDREACKALCNNYGCGSICVTRAANGAALLHRGEWYEHAGCRVQAVDTVGAGDAFLAALIRGLLMGAEPQEALTVANGVGAYVATQPGATPPLDSEEISALIRS